MADPTLEDVYDALAEGIDRHGSEKSEMFLAKICLLLAKDLASPERCLTLISEAEKNMHGMRPSSARSGE